MSRLEPPALGGVDQLRLFLADIPWIDAPKVLGVHENTLRRWLRGESRIPRAVLEALYWRSTYGFQHAYTASHWTHRWAWERLKALEIPVRLVDVDAANDARWTVAEIRPNPAPAVPTQKPRLRSWWQALAFAKR